MKQFWLQYKEEGVILLMTVDALAAAGPLLKALPLGQTDLDMANA